MVLMVLASYDAVATEIASAKTVEYLVLGVPLYFKGRSAGEKGKLCSMIVCWIH